MASEFFIDGVRYVPQVRAAGLVENPRIKALREAKEEAQRFVAQADAAIVELSTDANKWHTVEFAGAKRNSMNLTRALARLRRTQCQGGGDT